MSQSTFPPYRLFLGTIKSVLISGPHIHVLDTITGQVLESTSELQGEYLQEFLKSGPIRLAAVDSSFKHLAISAEDKKLKVWALDGLKLLSERELPKRPTEILFTKTHPVILVADKFGDVFSYPIELQPREQVLLKEIKRDPYSSHENTSGGNLILGHASLLTSVLLSHDEQFIVTADRDEHIRVSWYPEGYNIEMYCLGHSKYVSAIHIPTFSPSTLISGGGDSMLKVWDWRSGVTQSEIEILEDVRKYAQVKPMKRKRGSGGEDGEKSQGKGKNAKRRAKRTVANADLGDETHESKESSGPRAASGVLEDFVLVVQKLLSFQTDDGKFIVFSAVGASALFLCSFPETNGAVDIHAFDFAVPVLDFCIAESGTIWTLLDAHWKPSGSEQIENEGKFVRVVKWVLGEFVEVEEGPSGLLSSLNSYCPVTASIDELKALNFYDLLTSMPKSAEVDFEDPVEDPGDLGSSSRQLTKRELGRLKNKMALQGAAETQRTAEGSEDLLRVKRSKSELEGESFVDIEMS